MWDSPRSTTLPSPCAEPRRKSMSLRNPFRRGRSLAIWALALLIAVGCAPGGGPTVGGSAAIQAPPAPSSDQQSLAAVSTTAPSMSAATDPGRSSNPVPLGRAATSGAGPSAWRRARASSYGVGDGLLGTRLACGGTLTPSALAVANPTLPCGTSIYLRLGRRTVVATVRDRRPTVPGMTFLLSPAVCGALRDCSANVSLLWRPR
jgi:hypothetical protein